ncbi:MAG: phage integrase SAM-like domain-containing protein [Bacteroidales bacterium]|nr:phage integrase SAM-like domain-containing protein [Bacteroidales bacterium]
MNIVIKSDFQFSVTSIRYAPNGELCIELSSENGNPKNRYQYTADLGSGQAEEKPLVSLVDYSRKFMENSRIKEKSKDPYRQMLRFLGSYGDCTLDKITTEYLQGFISHLQTEDNRLTNIVDDGYFSYYAYDHSGERVLKLTGHNTVLDINADDAQFYSYVDEVTLYTSPYLVANNYGYTKHYYAGTERVCASIGNGNLNRNGDFIDDDVSDYITTTYLYTNCIEAMNDRVLSWNPAADVLTSCGNTLTSFPHILDPIPVNIFAQTLVNTDPFNDAMDIYSNTT